MAPRTGIRGVTLNDVADVANQGSSVMRGGYTFTRPASGGRMRVPSVRDVLAGMTSLRMPTAGEKYSGFPTATAQEAAVLGSIEPFYALGDYARQLAEQRMGSLIDERAMQAENLRSGAESELAAAQARLDAERARRAFGPVGATPEPSDLEADRDLAAYGAAMAARNQYAFARPRVELDPVTGTYTDIVTPYQAGLQQTALTSAENQPEFRQEIAPLSEFGQQVAEVPRYELARQMATQYFGMDPSLAAGTFTPQIDIDYMQMQQDLAEQQNLAMGINPEATVEDTLLQLDPSGQRLATYQEQLALEAENKFLEGRNNAVEDEWDQTFEMANGYPVEVAAGDYSLSTTREILNDENFRLSVNSALEEMQNIDPDMVMSNEDRKRIADAMAARYLAQNEDNPVAARILLNILYHFTFTIPMANTSLP